MDTRYIDDLNCFVDLHLHLDGAISLDNAKKVASLLKMDLGSDEKILQKLQVKEDCQSLSDLLKCFAFPNQLLQTKASLKLATANLLEELEEQGLMYVEIRFAPQKSCEQGLTQKEAVESVLEAIEESNLEARLILCALRIDESHRDNLETLRLVKLYENKGVVALDLAGNEADYSKEHFEELFEIAQSMGVNTICHAGEACGANRVKEAMDEKVKRIGHGVRCVEDLEVLNEVASKKIPLELCPSSNLCTMVYDDLSKFPLQTLLAHHVVVTISTDDPTIINTTIKDEYKKLIQQFDLSLQQVKQLLINSISSAFIDEETYNDLMNRLNQSFDLL